LKVERGDAFNTDESRGPTHQKHLRRAGDPEEVSRRHERSLLALRTGILSSAQQEERVRAVVEELQVKVRDKGGAQRV
jgi:hypothetical protein